MRRFWFEFEAGTWAQLEAGERPTNGLGPASASGGEGVGVTGRDERECLEIVRAKIFDGRVLPTVDRVVPDVDVSTLGDYVLRNMEPPIWRGIWFPVGYADPPTT
jgi:hypothetical protein